MITSQSTNEEILSAVYAELPKAEYWFEKRFKDNRETSRIRRKILDEHRRTGQVQIGGHVEYHSPSGNQWSAFLRSAKVGGEFIAQKCSFIYRETIGSFEIILPVDGYSAYNQIWKGVLIFTNHFFLRMRQRVGVEKIDLEAAIRLLSCVDHTIFHQKGDSNKRKNEIEISIMGTVWRGVYRDKDEHVMELKTMIPKTELSKRDRKGLLKIDRAQQNAVFHQKDIDVDRIKNQDRSLLSEMYDNAFVLGVNDRLSEIFYDFTHITKLTFDRLCVPFDFDEYINLLLKDMEGEALMWENLITSAYDHDADKLIDDASIFTLITLMCFGHKFPTGPATEMFCRSYKEYWGDSKRVIDENKKFFVLKDKRLFQQQMKMGQLVGESGKAAKVKTK